MVNHHFPTHVRVAEAYVTSALKTHEEIDGWVGVGGGCCPDGVCEAGVELGLAGGIWRASLKWRGGGARRGGEGGGCGEGVAF